MNESLLAVVLDAAAALFGGVLVLVLAGACILLAGLLWDARSELAQVKVENRQLRNQRRPRPEPVPLDRWPFDLSEAEQYDIARRTSTPDVALPSEDGGPLLLNRWEQPPPVKVPGPWPDPDPAALYKAAGWGTVVPAVDVVDDLEQIADLWHERADDQPLPDDVTLAELGERWIATEAQAAEHGWPPLIASAPADTYTNREGAGADGPDRGGDAGPDGETTPATGPLDAATSDGAHSHDVGRTGPEPTPHAKGEGVDRPSTVGPNPVDMWVGLAAQDLAG